VTTEAEIRVIYSSSQAGNGKGRGSPVPPEGSSPPNTSLSAPQNSLHQNSKFKFVLFEATTFRVVIGKRCNGFWKAAVSLCCRDPALLVWPLLMLV
jgi:hypothetical protein